MRILWHSTSPMASSGYGVVTKEIIQRLKAMGHFVRVGTKHEDHGWYKWNGFEVFEGTDTFFINQMIKDEDFDYIVTLWDIWLLNGKRQYPKKKWVAYIPIDTEWISKVLAKVCLNTGVQIAMSRHGERELKSIKLNPFYAPHGIDTEVFKPNPDSREAFRDELGLTEEHFVIGSVGLNYGDDRKGYILLMQAFKEFHKQHPKSVLYLHSLANERNARSGFINYHKIALNLGIDKALIWPPQLDYVLSRIDANWLAEIYNGFDVFCLPTKGEGFGLPIIEAQACFPAGTNVYANNIYRKSVRIYSGELISIETKHGIIEVTPEHPFWTNNGWVLARHLDNKSQLLYNSKYDGSILGEKENAKEGVLSLFQGRIENASEVIPQNDISKSGAKNGQNLQFGSMAKTSNGVKKTFFSNNTKSQTQSNEFRNGILSWFNRRRRKYRCKEIWETIKDIYKNYRNIVSFERLAFGKNKFAWNMVGNQTSQRQKERSICFPYSRNDTFIDLQKISSIVSNQKETHGISRGVLSREINSKQNAKANKTATKNCINDSESKYESTISIKRRIVSNLPVYNFTTSSGIYFAKGYLVHNCGVPVILTNTTSCPELCKAGWLIEMTDDDKRWLPNETWRLEAKPSAILKSLEDAYSIWESGGFDFMRKEARQKILEYSWDNVWEKHWLPIFKELEKRLKGRKK